MDNSLWYCDHMPAITTWEKIVIFWLVASEVPVLGTWFHWVQAQERESRYRRSNISHSYRTWSYSVLPSGQGQWEVSSLILAEECQLPTKIQKSRRGWYRADVTDLQIRYFLTAVNTAQTWLLQFFQMWPTLRRMFHVHGMEQQSWHWVMPTNCTLKWLQNH